MSEALPDVDWGQFAGMPEMTCFCRCGGFPGFQFRSHTKLIKHGDHWLHITEQPCPNCGAHDNLRSSESDPEQFTVRR